MAMNSLRNIMIRMACLVLFHTGYFDRKISQVKGKAIILMYHRVSNFYGVGEYHNPYKRGIDLPRFEQQMRFISEKMHPIHMQTLVSRIREGKGIHPKSIIVTFDDGYEDNYTNAFPILKKYSIPATIFLTVGSVNTKSSFWWDVLGELIEKSKVDYLNGRTLERLIGRPNSKIIGRIPIFRAIEKDRAVTLLSNKLKKLDTEHLWWAVEGIRNAVGLYGTELEKQEMLNWEQIEEMSQVGIEFGSHTVTHPDLGRIGQHRIESELRNSKKILESKLERRVQGIAIPYGLKQNYDSEVLNLVKKVNYQYCLTAVPGTANSMSDVFEMRRVSGGSAFLPIFVWKISKYMQQN